MKKENKFISFIKRRFNAKDLFVFIGFILIILAFILSFFASISSLKDGLFNGYNGLIFGKMYHIWDVPANGANNFVRHIEEVSPDLYRFSLSGRLGAILVLIFGVVAVVINLLFRDKYFSKWLLIGVGILVLCCGFMILFTKESFILSSVDQMIVSGSISPDMYDYAVEQMTKNLIDMTDDFGIIIPGIFAIFAGIIICIAQCLTDDTEREKVMFQKKTKK